MRLRFFVFLPLFLFLLTPGLHADSSGQDEKKLLQSLKFSSTNRDRQVALTQLYHYYKRKKISYLELSYLLKLIEVQKINRDFAGLETSYHGLAEIYEHRKDFLRALDYLFEALVYSNLVEKKKNRSGYVYLNISKIFRIINRKELAKKYIKKALDYTIKHKNEDLKVLVLSAYSKLSYEDEDYADALKFINLSLKTEKRKEKYLDAVHSLYRKALILLKMAEENGKINEAVELLKAAVDMGLKKKKYKGLLPIMSEYIEKLIAFDRFPEATDYLKKIDDIYAPYYPYYFFYYYLESIYFEKKGDMSTALTFYRKTANKLGQYFSGLNMQQYDSFSEKTGEIYSRIIEFYLDMFNRTDNHTYIIKALYFSEIKNAYIYDLVNLGDKTYTHFMEEKEKLEKEFLQCSSKYLHLLKNGDREDSENLHFYKNKLERLKRQNEELMEFIRETPLAYKKYDFKDFNIPLIQRKLHPGQLIIKYTVLEKSSYAFCIGSRSIGYWELTETTEEILNKVKQLTEPLDDFTEGQVDYLRVNYNLQLARQLYEILVKEIWQFQETIDEVFIVPDRELFKLPFEALVTGFNQRDLDPDVVFSEYSSADYLLEKFPVSYFISLFHFQKQAKPLKRNKYTYTIAAFGSPIVEKRFFHPLPSSEKEVLSIRSIFGKKEARVFLNEDFNKHQFEAHAPQSRILHIATHFINDINYPQNSALLFSPPGNENGSPFYYAHEIFKLTLNTELVVLSACESAEKRLLGLQGLRGITASFRHSGVQSMMVSMWPVDEQSSQLIPIFYREYKTNPQISISSALRSAKLKLMKQTAVLENGLNISFSHPFLWGNYILYNFR